MTTLESTFDNGTLYPTKLAKTKVSKYVTTDQVEIYYQLDLSGTEVQDAIDKDFNVTLQNGLRKSFLKGKVTDDEAQELLRDWASKNATEENPYTVHVNDLGKMIKTKEQRKAEVEAGLRALKASMSEEEFNALVQDLD